MLLRKSEHVADWDLPKTLSLAKSAKGNDDEGYRAELIRLIEMSEML
jgi:Ca-activated chloride channel family protein